MQPWRGRSRADSAPGRKVTRRPQRVVDERSLGGVKDPRGPLRFGPLAPGARERLPTTPRAPRGAGGTRGFGGRRALSRRSGAEGRGGRVVGLRAAAAGCGRRDGPGPRVGCLGLDSSGGRRGGGSGGQGNPPPQDYTVRASGANSLPKRPSSAQKIRDLSALRLFLHPPTSCDPHRMSWRPAHPSSLRAVVISFLWPVAHPR